MQLHELRRVVDMILSIRQRGSTTAAITGANSNGSTLIVNNSWFMGWARDKGAKKVQTVDSLRYGNPIEGGIVFDHYAVACLAMEAIGIADAHVKIAREEAEKHARERVMLLAMVETAQAESASRHSENIRLRCEVRDLQAENEALKNDMASRKDVDHDDAIK